MEKKILTISLLVSGREDTTIRCLDSIKPLLEQLDAELILVDTGCQKELRQNLQKYTNHIVPFVWCNDFAKARNAGLEPARGEWFLYLDDDEWFEDVTPIIEFFKTGEYKSFQQAVYKVRNYSNLEGTAYEDEWVSRMMCIEDDTHFEGRVHESLVPARGNCKKLEAFVHHFGYAFKDEEERAAHKNRNVSILERLIAEEPNNMRWRLQVLQEFAEPEDAKRLREEALSAIDMVSAVDRKFVNQCRGAFYTAVLLADYGMKDAKLLLEDADLFLQDERNPLPAKCSICRYALIAEKELHGAQDFLSIEKYAHAYLQFYEMHRKEQRTEQEQIIEESILFVKDMTTEEIYEKTKLEWAIAKVNNGTAKEIGQEFRDEVMQKIRLFMEGNGEFLFLPEEIWTLAKAKVLPLEEALLSLPFSQWMAMVIVLEARKSQELWSEIESNLSGICTGEDIRYSYFDVHRINTKILGYYDGINYEEMLQLLQEFTLCNLSYGNQVYTQAAFEGEMEMLEENVRAAVWIDRFLECEPTNWAEQLEYLKKSAQAWPKLGDAVKYFAALIGEEQERQAAQAKAAQDELASMAAQIKVQVNTLLEAGMYKEALEIVRTLRQMLPEDKDIAGLEKKLEKQFS